MAFELRIIKNAPLISGGDVCRRLKNIVPSIDIPAIMLNPNNESIPFVTEAKLALIYNIFNNDFEQSLEDSEDPENIDEENEYNFDINACVFSNIFVDDLDLLKFINGNYETKPEEPSDEDTVPIIEFEITDYMEDLILAKHELEDILFEVEFPLDTYLALLLSNPDPSSYFITYERMKGEYVQGSLELFQDILTVEGELNEIGKSIVRTYTLKIPETRKKIKARTLSKIDALTKISKTDPILFMFNTILNTLQMKNEFEL